MRRVRAMQSGMLALLSTLFFKLNEQTLDFIWNFYIQEEIKGILPIEKIIFFGIQGRK